MKANSQKQRCLALQYDLLECFALLVMLVCTVIASAQQEEVVMTSRLVGQEGHCFFVVYIRVRYGLCEV